MANADRVPDGALADVANQINQRIGGVARNLLTSTTNEDAGGFESANSPSSMIARKIDLGETFAVWMLTPEKISSGVKQYEDLVRLATNTGNWHHQIRVDGRGMAYARSMPSEENDRNELWSLCELGVSQLAEDIQAATDWSDDNVSDEYVMRLLVVPSRQVRAFWFIDEANQTSSVYVISSPSSFKEVRKNRSMSSREFLVALADEREISGYQ